jgi:hypothetical protein
MGSNSKSKTRCDNARHWLGQRRRRRYRARIVNGGKILRNILKKILHTKMRDNRTSDEEIETHDNNLKGTHGWGNGDVFHASTATYLLFGLLTT